MSSDPHDLLGRTLGGYQIDRLLGGGGMGVVFLGYEVADPTHVVAIKVLQPSWQMLATPNRNQIRQRFANEAEILRQLRHPHILRLLASGEEDGLLYMALPYIAGKTLAERTAAGPLPLDEVARIGGQVAEAMAYAHNLGVIHRDIKPSNILLDDQGNIYLADFSIAKVFDLEGTTLTGTGQVLGTLGYMAPEQMLGKSATAYSDQYSLGVLYFEMVTGRSFAQERSTTRIPAPRDFRPDLPQAASDAIMRTLRVETRARYPSVRDFANAFTQGLLMPTEREAKTATVLSQPDVVLSTLISEIAYESANQRVRVWRHRVIDIILAIFVVLVALLGFVIYRFASQPSNSSVLTTGPGAGITCDQLEHSVTHYHTAVHIAINGVVTPLPANIGINQSAGCLYWIHTHDTSGVVHIEAPANARVYAE